MATTALQALDNTLCTYQNNPKDIVELELKCKNKDKWGKKTVKIKMIKQIMTFYRSIAMHFADTDQIRNVFKIPLCYCKVIFMDTMRQTLFIQII